MSCSARARGSGSAAFSGPAWRCAVTLRSVPPVWWASAPSCRRISRRALSSSAARPIASPNSRARECRTFADRAARPFQPATGLAGPVGAIEVLQQFGKQEDPGKRRMAQITGHCPGVQSTLPPLFAIFMHSVALGLVELSLCCFGHDIGEPAMHASAGFLARSLGERLGHWRNAFELTVVPGSMCAATATRDPEVEIGRWLGDSHFEFEGIEHAANDPAEDYVSGFNRQVRERWAVSILGVRIHQNAAEFRLPQPKGHAFVTDDDPAARSGNPS